MSGTLPELAPSYVPIRDWREDEKPRERLAKHGGAVLSDAELIAILLGTGTRSRSAIDCAKDLLDEYKDVQNISSLDYSFLKKIKGIGTAKAVTLAAAFELSKRIKAEPFGNKTYFKSPEQIAAYFIPRFSGEKQEKFIVVLMSSSNRIIRYVTVGVGSLNEIHIHPREVFKIAISESAASVVLLHNHPSGNPEPSFADIELTKRLVKGGEMLGISVLDHIIIAGEGFTSFVSRGLL